MQASARCGGELSAWHSGSHARNALPSASTFSYWFMVMISSHGWGGAGLFPGRQQFTCAS
jgi:hypothetical protein